MSFASQRHPGALKLLLHTACACICIAFIPTAPAQSHRDANGTDFQSSNKQAIALAKRLGRELSAEGLETIIGIRNVELLEEYGRNLEAGLKESNRGNDRARKLLPADIEALVVKHYADAELGAVLRGFFANGGVRYQSRALFDLMYAEWTSGYVRPSTGALRNSILATDLAGIEQPLLDLLKKPAFANSYDGQAVIGFLAERKFRPATPLLGVLAQSGKANDESSRRTYDALLIIGGNDANAAILKKLKWLRDQPSAPAVTEEIEYLMGELAIKIDVLPWQYGEFRKSLPAILTTKMKRYLIEINRRTSETQGTPEILTFLATPSLFDGALGVLSASESPEVWTKTRDEIARLRQAQEIGAAEYNNAKPRLDRMIANPDEVFAERKRQDREKSFDTRLAALKAHANELRRRRDAVPEEFVGHYDKYLQSLLALAAEFAELPRANTLRQSIDSEYVSLAGYVRFKLKQPLKAIDLYERGARTRKGTISRIGLVDTLLFDLRDAKRALAALTPTTLSERTKSAEPAGNEIDAAFAGWYSNWVRHQTEFLKSGKSFSGSMGQAQFAECTALVFLGGAMTSGDDMFGLAPLYARRTESARQPGGGPAATQMAHDDVAKKLTGLPASNLTLMSTLGFVGSLPDAGSILEYVARHDPAGYISACLFATVSAAAKGGDPGHSATRLHSRPGIATTGADTPIDIAAERFLSEHKISVGSETKFRRK